ncbi:MAG: phenylalanine--tRNA ligase subunit alpha, partial [bacterium]
MSTAKDLIANLERLADEFVDAVRPLADEQAIRAAQAAFLGKKGKLSELMKELGRLPAGDRPAVGAAANKAKQAIEDRVAARLGELADAAGQKDLARTVDISLPARPVGGGTLHLLSQVRLEAIQIFSEIGFVVADGPQIETDWHTFEALAIPKDHPARDMQDTLYLDAPIVGGTWGAHRETLPESQVRAATLLRTHTSAMQIRYMKTYQPPVRIIVPGRVYRRDNLDLSHTPMFQQFEGLVVGEG